MGGSYQYTNGRSVFIAFDNEDFYYIHKELDESTGVLFVVVAPTLIIIFWEAQRKGGSLIQEDKHGKLILLLVCGCFYTESASYCLL